MTSFASRLPRLVVLSALFVAVVASESRAAALDDALGEGWNAWRVAADMIRTTRCCYSWSIGQPTMQACDLDRRTAVSVVQDNTAPDHGEMQLYALIESGRATRILALSPQCPVSTKSGISDLGLLESGTSFDWLHGYVTRDDRLSEDALAAIAAHSGSVNALIGIVENRGLPMGIREQALFWMAQSDSDEAFDFFTSILARN